MSDAGVIPRPEDQRRWHPAGKMHDVDGTAIELAYRQVEGLVRIWIDVLDGSWHAIDLDKDAREQFMRLWCEAERQAEASDG